MEYRDVIIHVHIFKNAGSSFDSALLGHFNKSFIDHRDDHLIRNDPNFLKEYLANHSHIKAFSSHSIYHKPESFDNIKLHTVYLLRHPIERIRSVYHFEKKQPAEDSSGAMMAKKLNFLHYLAWRMRDDTPATIRNLQTIFLAGIGPDPAQLEKKYKMALKTVTTSPLIGVVDRYDESMVVFEEFLQQFFPNIDLSYTRKNITDKNIDISASAKAEKILTDIGRSLADTVYENNRYDLVLYQKANTLLNEKIDKIDHYKNKLSNFRIRCKLKNIVELLKQKKYDQAEKLAGDELKSYPDNVSFHLRYAEALELNGKGREALDKYNDTLYRFPNNVYIYLFKGRYLARVGMKKEAEQILSFARMKFPDKIDQINTYIDKIIYEKRDSNYY